MLVFKTAKEHFERENVYADATSSKEDRLQSIIMYFYFGNSHV